MSIFLPEGFYNSKLRDVLASERNKISSWLVEHGVVVRGVNNWGFPMCLLVLWALGNWKGKVTMDTTVIKNVNCKLALAKSIVNDWTARAFAIGLCRDWTLCCWAVDLQHPLREFRVERGTLCSTNLVAQVFGLLDIFRNRFYDPNPGTSSYLEKQEIPSWWHQILPTSRKPFVKWVLNGTELPLHQNLNDDLPSLRLWSSLSEISEVLLPRLQSSFCPKENLTRNSQVVIFFSQQYDNCWSDPEWNSFLCLNPVKNWNSDTSCGTLSPATSSGNADKLG